MMHFLLIAFFRRQDKAAEALAAYGYCSDLKIICGRLYVSRKYLSVLFKAVVLV